MVVRFSSSSPDTGACAPLAGRGGRGPVEEWGEVMSDGYATGYDTAWVACYDHAYPDGFDAGYDIGWVDGANTGYEQGWQQGFDDAAEGC